MIHIATSPDASHTGPAHPLDPATVIRDDLPGRWWVAHTKPRNEKALARVLEVQRIHFYLPLCRHTTYSSRTGRRSQSIVPVFPGYLFFNGTEEQRVAALTSNRIAKTLPVVNQAGLIRELRHIERLLSANVDFTRSPSLKVGEWARVRHGPLVGVEGVVCQRLAKYRLALNVRTLAQSVLVEVAEDMLERIDPPAWAV